MMKIKVAIFQHRLLHYRVRLFEELRERLNDIGIELVLVHGNASARESVRRDEGILDWSVKVRNAGFRIAGKDIIWQPFPYKARDADLIVLLQENRIISNYIRQIGWRNGKAIVSFWGHGKNYQALKPDGLRERWKRYWMRKVGWWFAYTQGSAQFIVEKGFPPSQVTVLNNAIDAHGFRSDLCAVSDGEVATEKDALGIRSVSQVAIYCGSIYAEKRIGLMLQAADLLRKQLPDFHLLVVGDGPEAATVRDAAVSRPWLHVRGIRKGRDKALDYRLAQVMLNPGAVGLHIVDAFVAGAPLVTQASALHGPEYDYLRNGINGISVDDDSAEAYAAAVASLFLHPDRLAAMQAECAADAQRYTVERMADNFVQGIVDCLRHHRRLPG